MTAARRDHSSRTCARCSWSVYLILFLAVDSCSLPSKHFTVFYYYGSFDVQALGSFPIAKGKQQTYSFCLNSQEADALQYRSASTELR